MSTTERPQTGGAPDPEVWSNVQSGPDFADLRRRLRRFVFPMTVLFLSWYWSTSC